MVFVFATLTMVNANSNVERLYKNAIVEENGGVRYCMGKAMEATEAIAEAFGEDIRGENEDFYLSVYTILYEGCMLN